MHAWRWCLVLSESQFEPDEACHSNLGICLSEKKSSIDGITQYLQVISWRHSLGPFCCWTWTWATSASLDQSTAPAGLSRRHSIIFLSSFWNRVNLDSSDHVIIFRCSGVQICSPANSRQFSPLRFLGLRSCSVALVSFELCVWKYTSFHYETQPGFSITLVLNYPFSS